MLKIFGYSLLTVVGAILVGYGIYVLVSTRRNTIFTDIFGSVIDLVWSPVVILGVVMIIAGVYNLF